MIVGSGGNHDERFIDEEIFNFGVGHESVLGSQYWRLPDDPIILVEEVTIT